MSLHHFFLDEQVIADQSESPFALELSPDDRKHARVLRLEPGEHIAVVDAAHDYFECEITRFDAEGPMVRIAQRMGSTNRPARVTLVQGLAKGDKMDSVLRHATELGVDGFIPVAFERSVVKLDAAKAAKRLQRWSAIVRSAAMQSGQPFLPQVEHPCDVVGLAKRLADFDAVLICWEEADHVDSLSAAMDSAAVIDAAPCSIAVVVGPEGGISAHEVELLLASNPHAFKVSLGPSILRTETAGIVAPALVLHELGRLG